MKHEIRYGKAAIRCYRAFGGGRPLFASEVTVDVHGDAFLASYTEGDNSRVVATDTMKNFTYAALAEFEGDAHEDWCMHLGRRFLDTYADMEWVRVSERELRFDELSRALHLGRPDESPHGVVELDLGRDGVRRLRGGMHGLRLLKITGSAFAAFARDRYTTLPERVDRPLYVYLDVDWTYGEGARPIDPDAVGRRCAEIFDGYVSLSIQQLLNEFGRHLLAEYPAAEEFTFNAQNRTLDVSAEGPGEGWPKVFSDPKPAHGSIWLRVRR